MADDKVAVEKTAAEKTTQDTAAAQKAAADIAVANKTLAEKPVVVVGTDGGPFNIDGEGFGSSGTLTIGGQQIKTTRWNDKSIKGTLPKGVKGAVVLQTGSGVRHGVFPAPPHVTLPPLTIAAAAAAGAEAAVKAVTGAALPTTKV